MIENTTSIANPTILTNPEKYRGATEADLGYADYRDSQYFDYISPETGQRTGVFVADPVKVGEGENLLSDTLPEKVIIYPQAHEYRHEPSSMARLQQMASAYDARVIGVETVGTVGLMHADEYGKPQVYETLERLDGDRQTSSQLSSALRGDFRPHAKAQLEAIQGTIGMRKDARYTIFGESMGAAVATDMLGLLKEDGFKVDEVVFYEMVNAFKGVRPLLPINLMRVLPGIENDRRNQYIKENTAIDKPMTAFELVSDAQRRLDTARKSIGQQAIAGLVNGLGMATGRTNALYSSLEYFDKSKAPLLTLVRGEDSLATNKNDYTQLYTGLKRSGYAVRRFDVADASSEKVPIGHSHLFSLGRGKDIYDELAR